jgi:hypothetical protein
MSPSPEDYLKKRLYHITDIENLDSIVNGIGCLLSHNELRTRGIIYEDQSDSEIQEVRATRRVDISPYGVLHDYVPFFFCFRPPMLHGLKNGRGSIPPKDQDQILYLVTSVERIVAAGLTFVFSDVHARSPLADFYQEIDDMNVIDWNVIADSYWSSRATERHEEDASRPLKKQAEFLIHRECPWSVTGAIVTRNEAAKGRVDAIIQSSSHKPTVKARREWYYN